MLRQEEADALIDMEKLFASNDPIQLPGPGAYLERQLVSADERKSFLLDVNRRGRILTARCTYQMRYQVTIHLLRLDVNGPPHTNPDDEHLAGPHIHRYREGYDDKWADPVSEPDFPNLGDVRDTFLRFLDVCNVVEIPDIQGVLL
ncbi:MAG: hypothetical protein ACE5R4_05755 [Armatimonadota bacterium]